MTRRLFGTIIKRGTRYLGKYRVDGRYYYTPTVATKREADHLLTQIHADILRDTWQPPRHATTSTDLTLTQWLPLWIDRLTTGGYSPNTTRTYSSRWKAHIIPYFGADTRLDQITTDAITQFNQTLRGSCPDTTRRSILRDLSAALTDAVKAGALATKPDMPHDALTIRHTSQARPEHITYTYDQIHALADACEPRLAAAIILGGIGALRSGEISALTRSDISADGVTVTVSKAVKRGMGGELVVGPPKSSAGFRRVHLDDRSARRIVMHLDQWVDPEREALVFPPVSGRIAFTSDRVLRRALHEACDRVGVVRGRFHDLRHSGLTLYGQAGATIADLMARAGHTSPDTVMIYQHSTAQRDAELVGRLRHTSNS
ncbi:MAG: tyrosine-type recombinase/integrase [Actinomycetaceae bacterium]|nr:site-specific integrase [Arcanobacterium sp.]MDD7505585.1 tyrosine-type recombinase/integrase [Actinomycetaceae bacterium]MDY6143796.1 tyrosine-type recombinase/integrase [Arcanobacterium sp.]